MRLILSKLLLGKDVPKYFRMRMVEDIRSIWIADNDDGIFEAVRQLLLDLGFKDYVADIIVETQVTSRSFLCSGRGIPGTSGLQVVLPTSG